MCLRIRSYKFKFRIFRNINTAIKNARYFVPKAIRFINQINILKMSTNQTLTGTQRHLTAQMSITSHNNNQHVYSLCKIDKLYIVCWYMYHTHNPQESWRSAKSKSLIGLIDVTTEVGIFRHIIIICIYFVHPPWYSRMRNSCRCLMLGSYRMRCGYQETQLMWIICCVMSSVSPYYQYHRIWRIHIYEQISISICKLDRCTRYESQKLCVYLPTFWHHTFEAYIGGGWKKPTHLRIHILWFSFINSISSEYINRI